MRYLITGIFLLTVISFSFPRTYAAQGEGITIAVSTLDKEHIELAYHLPKSCKKLELSNPYKEMTNEIRKQWAPIDNCGKISANGFLIVAQECTVARFAIPIQSTVIDGAYPTAYPFAGTGVFTHTGIFAADDSCGESTWQFSSKKGSIVIDGTSYRGAKIIKQSKNKSIHYTGIFLSYKPQPNNPLIIADESSPGWLTRRTESSAAELLMYYRQTYPQRVIASPTLMISNIANTEDRTIQADVSSPKMIRLSFLNAGEKPDDQYIDTIRRLTSHEFAHLLQYQPKVKQSPFILEGGAEFVRWMAQYNLGWLTGAQLSNELSAAMRSCLDVAGEKSWNVLEQEDLQQGNQIYTCGFVVHVLGLASRQASESAERTLATYYRDVEQGHDLVLSKALECGHLQNCTPGWLSEIFSSSRSFAELVQEQLVRLDILKPFSYPIDAATQQVFSTKAFENLMNEDCGGYNYWTKSDHFYIDELPSECKTLKNGMKISKVEKYSYFEQPQQAVIAQNKGCNVNHFVTLTAPDGSETKVKCSTQYDFQRNYFVINEEKLLRLLGKKE